MTDDKFICPNTRDCEKDRCDYHNKPHEMGEWCLRSCPFAETDPNNICRPFGIVTVEDEQPLENFSDREGIMRA